MSAAAWVDYVYSIEHHAVHTRLRRARGPASDQACVDCGARARDWSQTHGTSGYDISRDYLPRCRSCHRRYDATRPTLERDRCKHGHVYAEVGSYIGSSTGTRICRQCDRDKAARHRSNK